MLYDKVIYILSLEQGKFYVGKTGNVPRRLNDHFKGRGAAWTKMFKPIKVMDILENQSLFTEDNITKQLMDKYGIGEVRGGSYCQIKLSKCDLYCLQKELWGMKGLCFLCGKNHFVNHRCRHVEYNK
jgi:excinuclease UvrABC nuclease subunit